MKNSGFKLWFSMQNGSKVWINLHHIVKMVETNDGYCIYLTNGDKYIVDKKTAKLIENYFYEPFEL